MADDGFRRHAFFAHRLLQSFKFALVEESGIFVVRVAQNADTAQFSLDRQYAAALPAARASGRLDDWLDSHSTRVPQVPFPTNLYLAKPFF